MFTKIKKLLSCRSLIRGSASLVAFVMLLLGSVPGFCGEERAVKKGEQISHSKGLYKFAVPDENYKLIEYSNALGMVLTPEEAYFGKKGNYAINLFPQGSLPAEMQGDPQKSFEWIRENIIEKKSKKSISVVHSESQSFQGENALRVEYYLPGDFQKRTTGLIAIKRPPYGYVAMVFYHSGYLFWVYHADPIDEYDAEEPHVEDIARQEYDVFLNSFSLEIKPA